MNKNYVIDANIFAKLLLNEDESVIAENLITKIINDEDYILVPSIFTYEIIGVFKKHKLPANIITDFIKFYHIRPHIRVIDLNNKIINLALEITESGNIKSGFPSFYDSTYHALAILNNCDFITADKKHFDKARDFGYIKILDA